MANSEQETTRWQNKAFLNLRIIFLAGITLALYIWRSQGDAPVEDYYTDIAVIFGIGAMATIAVGLSLFVASLAELLPIMTIIGDLIIAGACTYFTDADPVFMEKYKQYGDWK